MVRIVSDWRMWVAGKVDADQVFDELLVKHGKEVVYRRDNLILAATKIDRRRWKLILWDLNLLLDIYLWYVLDNI